MSTANPIVAESRAAKLKRLELDDIQLFRDLYNNSEPAENEKDRIKELNLSALFRAAFGRRPNENEKPHVFQLTLGKAVFDDITIDGIVCIVSTPEEIEYVVYAIDILNEVEPVGMPALHVMSALSKYNPAIYKQFAEDNDLL